MRLDVANLHDAEEPNRPARETPVGPRPCPGIRLDRDKGPA
jgi:hypothetical protein